MMLVLVYGGAHRGNSVVDLSASTKAGLVMLLKSPLMVAIDCTIMSQYRTVAWSRSQRESMPTARNCFRLLACAELSAILLGTCSKRDLECSSLSTFVATSYESDERKGYLCAPA